MHTIQTCVALKAASQSIIPVDTKLAAGITRFFPQFNDRFEAIAVRANHKCDGNRFKRDGEETCKANEVNLLLQKQHKVHFMV